MDGNRLIIGACRRGAWSVGPARLRCSSVGVAVPPPASSAWCSCWQTRASGRRTSRERSSSGHRRTTAALSARAFPLGGSESFGVWSQALEDHLRRLTADEVTALCGGYLDDLAALAHTVAAARGGAPAHEPSRRRLLQGLAAALANLAGNVCLRSWKRSGRTLAVV